jgi:hypothetical protein
MSAVAMVGLAIGGCGDPPGALREPATDAAASDAAASDAAAADADPDALPDLTIDLDRARADLAVREQVFADDACELDPDEACVGGPGPRRRLKLSVETPNVGDADLVLGAPSPDNDQFRFSTCHGHYHFQGYAAYRLLDEGGGELAVGRKQAFCLLDRARYLAGDGVPASPTYDCDYQGIQRGWADVYDTSLPCQFIDVTDVPDGAYRLEIRVNPDGTLAERDLENDVVTLPVELGGADLSTPTEACPADLGPAARRGRNRECGWTLEAQPSCEPGMQVHVACNATCGPGFGSCTGDPMLRVCDAARPDHNCSYPAAIKVGDDGCGTSCPIVTLVRCPPSGQLAVYAAPYIDGEPFSCAVVTRPAG